MNIPVPIPTAAASVDGLVERGEWNEAQDVLRRILQQKEHEAGSNHPETQEIRTMLAYVYRNQGHYRDAEILDAAVLEARRRSFGSEHPAAIAAMNNVALDIKGQEGRILEALDLERRALELTLRSSLQGPDDHPDLDVLARMHSLADTYFAHNHPVAAAHLHEIILRLRTSTLGPGHPHTIAIMDSLGRDYAAQGKFGSALRVQEDAVEAGRVHLGEEDLITLRCTVHLAETYGRVMAEAPGGPPNARAILLLERAVRILERTAGPENTDTVSLRYYLAVAYSRMGGRLGDAEALLAAVLLWSRQNMGAGNRTAVQIMRNLVPLYRHLGKLDQAREVEKDLERFVG